MTDIVKYERYGIRMPRSSSRHIVYGVAKVLNHNHHRDGEDGCNILTIRGHNLVIPHDEIIRINHPDDVKQYALELLKA